MTNETNERQERYSTQQILEMYRVARRLVQNAEHLEHLQACVDSIRETYEPRVKQRTREALAGYSRLPQGVREGIAKIEGLDVTKLEGFLK